VLDDSVCSDLPKLKKINSELLIDRMAALDVGETQIGVVTNKGDPYVSISWLENCVYLAQ